MNKIKHSIEDYLDLEQETSIKFEYHQGEIIAIAGATIEHQLITNRLIRLFEDCLAEQDCIVMGSDVKLHVPDCDKSFYYPDVHIYCGSPKKRKMDRGSYALEEPIVIVEVLSEATRDYDASDKFDCYQKIKNLKSYLIVDSTRYGITLRAIQSQTEQKFESLEDSFEMAGCVFSLEDVYKTVKL